MSMVKDNNAEEDEEDIEEGRLVGGMDGDGKFGEF